MYQALIVDAETNGREPPEIIELAAIDFDQVAIINARYKPSQGSTLGALSTHFILDSALADMPPSSQAVLPQCEYIIGHNIDYDWNALGKPDVKRICTLALAREFWPEWDSHKLTSCMFALFGDRALERVKGAHSALADCFMVRELIDAMPIPVGVSIADLWQLSEAARIPKVFTFGKHKGMAIKDAPSDYKAWLLRQPDVDPYLALALRA